VSCLSCGGDCRSIDKQTEIDHRLAAALAEARDTAYRVVVRPVEGTILTVSSDVAEAARHAIESGTTSGLEVLEQVVQAAEESVARTPDLPGREEAGVVTRAGKTRFIGGCCGQPVACPERA
jgi:dihydroxyacetone kinase-like predicted kinase